MRRTGLSLVVMVLVLAGAGRAQGRRPPTPLEAAVAKTFETLSAGNLAEAATEFKRLAREAAAFGDRGAEAEATRGLCRVAQRERKFDEAKPLCAKALEIADAGGHLFFAGSAANDLGILAFNDANHDAIRRYFEMAADRWERAGAPIDQARALTNITFSQAVSVEDKVRHVARAAAIGARAGNPLIEGNALHAWGDLLFVQGRYAEAVEKVTAAVAALEKAKSVDNLSRAYTSLGRAMRAHGHPARAIEVYQRGLALQEERKDLSGQVQSHIAIATSLEMLKRHDEALRHRERSVALAEESKSRRDLESSKGGLGIGYVTAKRYEEAVPLLRAAVADATPSVLRTMHRTWLARALSGLKEWPEALHEADLAVEDMRPMGQKETLTEVLIARARVRRDAGRGGDALADAREVLQLIEELRQQLVPDDYLKQGFTTRFREAYDLVIDVLVSQGQHGEALEAAEAARARAFVDLLASRRTERTDADLTLRSGAGGELTAAGLDAELASTVATRPANAADIAALARRLRSTVVSYWVDSDATYAWIVTPDGTTASRRFAVKEAELESLVRQISQGVGGPVRRGQAVLTTRGGSRLTMPRGRDAYRRLYDVLLKPFDTQLPAAAGARITVVPHGPLFGLSFAALQDARGRYLLERFTIHYAPSAATLTSTTTAERPPVPSTQFLLVADPTTGAAEKLPPLPGARREAAAIRSLFPAGATTMVVGKAASKARVTSLAGGSRVLHFATHGVVSDERPLDSYLALAGGRLTAREIYGLDLDADLVVLSACRSGSGKITGDGILGLTRAFFYAGTPSVIATVADVADVAADRTLPRFYRDWQRSGDKVGALRNAQLAFLRALRAGEVKVSTAAGDFVVPEHPALWSPFILIGRP